MQSSGFIDICFNCTHKAFQKDLAEILQRAAENKIKHMVAPATSLMDSHAVIAVAARYPAQLTAGVGVHPHLAHDWNDDTFNSLKNLIDGHPVAFVGEAGLDYCRNYSTLTEQHLAFEQQIRLAQLVQLPMLLHQRDAHQDFLALLRLLRGKLKNAVVHCFTSNKKELFDYLDLDLHIGITGWICDERRGQHLREIVKYIPPNRLMLETDAPYLLPRSLYPQPKHRRNEPMFLTHIAAEIAACCNISPQELAVFTSENAVRFFNLSGIGQAVNN